MDKSRKWPIDGYSEEEVAKIEELKEKIKALDEKELDMFFQILSSAAGEMLFAEAGRAERLLQYLEQAKMWIRMLKQIGKILEGDPEKFVQKVLSTPSIISMILANQGIIDFSSREFDDGLRTLRSKTEYGPEGHPVYSQGNYETAARVSGRSCTNLLKIPELFPSADMHTQHTSAPENFLRMPPVGGIQEFLVSRGRKSAPTVRERELARVLDRSEIAFEHRLRAIRIITMADVYGSAAMLRAYNNFFKQELEGARRVTEIMGKAIERNAGDSPIVQALRERFDANKRYRAFLETRMELETMLATGKNRMEMVNNPMNMAFFGEVPESTIRILLQQHFTEKRLIEERRGKMISGISPKERMLTIALRKKRNGRENSV
jgi:hypothetical protein